MGIHVGLSLALLLIDFPILSQNLGCKTDEAWFQHFLHTLISNFSMLDATLMGFPLSKYVLNHYYLP